MAGGSMLQLTLFLGAALSLIVTAVYLARSLGARLDKTAAFTGAAHEFTPEGRRHFRRFMLGFIVTAGLFIALSLVSARV